MLYKWYAGIQTYKCRSKFVYTHTRVQLNITIAALSAVIMLSNVYCSGFVFKLPSGGRREMTGTVRYVRPRYHHLDSPDWTSYRSGMKYTLTSSRFLVIQFVPSLSPCVGITRDHCGVVSHVTQAEHHQVNRIVCSCIYLVFYITALTKKFKQYIYIASSSSSFQIQSISKSK